MRQGTRGGGELVVCLSPWSRAGAKEAENSKFNFSHLGGDWDILVK